MFQLIGLPQRGVASKARHQPVPAAPKLQLDSLVKQFDMCHVIGHRWQGGVFPIDACCNMSLLRLGASMPCHRSLVSQAKVANLLARYDRTGRHKGCRSQNAILGMVPGSGQTL